MRLGESWGEFVLCDTFRGHLYGWTWVRALWAVFCVLLAVHPQEALADDSEDARIERAQDAVLEGRRALKEGRWLDGIRSYERAHAAFPQVNYLFTIASAYEKLPKRCADAEKAWMRFLAECGRCADRKAGQLRLKNVRSMCMAKNTGGAQQPVGGKQTAVQIAESDAMRFAKSGQFMKAITAYEKAYRLVPDAKYLFQVAGLYEKIPGRCPDAQLGWQRFLEACPQCGQRLDGERRKAANESRCAAPSAAPAARSAKPVSSANSAVAPPVQATAPTEQISRAQGSSIHTTQRQMYVLAHAGMVTVEPKGGTSESGYGVGAGAGLSWWFTQRLGLRAEALLQFTQFDIEFEGSEGRTESVASTMQSLNIPLMGQIRIADSDEFGLAVLLGLRADILLNATSKVADTELNTTSNAENTFAFGAPIGLAADFDANGTKMGIDFRAKFGLSDWAKDFTQNQFTIAFRLRL